MLCGNGVPRPDRVLPFVRGGGTGVGISRDFSVELPRHPRLERRRSEELMTKAFCRKNKPRGPLVVVDVRTVVGDREVVGQQWMLSQPRSKGASGYAPSSACFPLGESPSESLGDPLELG